VKENIFRSIGPVQLLIDISLSSKFFFSKFKVVLEFISNFKLISNDPSSNVLLENNIKSFKDILFPM